MTLTIYFAAAILSTGVWLAKPQTLSKQTLPTLLALAMAAGLANLAFLVALIEGEVLRVMLLFYLAPLWTLILGHWWLREKVSLYAIKMMALAMFGAVLMLWDIDKGLPWPRGWGDVLAIFAGMMFATNNVLSRKLAAVPMIVKTTVVNWGVVTLSMLVIVGLSLSAPTIAVGPWLLVAIVGGLVITSMTVAVLYGLANMLVFRAAIFMLFELVVAALSAWWLTDEQMNLREWLGGGLILLAGLLLVWNQEETH
jgi:drug/metabolite transporter (DMT)-like permease